MNNTENPFLKKKKFRKKTFLKQIVVEQKIKMFLVFGQIWFCSVAKHRFFKNGENYLKHFFNFTFIIKFPTKRTLPQIYIVHHFQIIENVNVILFL